jgi:hypothetical protein
LDGPGVIAASLSRPGRLDRYGNAWQYHSRSDRHSKIACWAVLYDLLGCCAALREHAAAGQVVIGVNQEMRDYQNGRKKNLDLVIARPVAAGPGPGHALGDLAVRWGVRLDPAQHARLAGLPQLKEGVTGQVLIAVEAKATMTAHIKALPRLYDELNSSHATVHGAIESALAVGFVLVNASETFVSSEMNRWPFDERAPVVSRHAQPLWAARALEKVRELDVRRTNRGQGFDAVGVTVLDMANDGSDVRVVTGPPAPDPRDGLHYEQMVLRIAQAYAAAFPVL